MTLRDLREFFDAGLALPIGGKTYRVPGPPMTAVERLRTTILTLTDQQELDEIAALLGPVHDEMLADGVAWPEYVHAGRTALYHHVLGAETASAHWHYAQLGELVDLDQVVAALTEATPGPAPAGASRAERRGGKKRGKGKRAR